MYKSKELCIHLVIDLKKRNKKDAGIEEKVTVLHGLAVS
jgi:hypothetical protein